MMTTHETKVQPYTMTELASLYGISPKTLKTWLEPHEHLIGERRGRYYNIKQVRIIFDCLGLP
jgi:uncharacterized protein YjcR